MRRTTVLFAVGALCLLPACGGDDDSEPADDAPAEADEPSGDESATEEPADGDAAAEDAPADEPPADQSSGDQASGGGATATLTLDNGETYEFGILCALEPQMAAGSEILFTVVSYDDPGLDITQFGNDGTITEMATVSVYDGNFETLWEAGSLYEAFGGTLELTLDGSTVRGEGGFFPNADIAAEPVGGVVEARCG